MTTPIRAALFELDGPLIDSEVHTDTAIRVIAERHGVAGFALPHTETRGRTWAHIADAMRTEGRVDAKRDALADELLAYWTEIAVDVTPVPGAPEALREAAQSLRLAIVSSSPRTVIDSFLAKLGVADCIEHGARIGADAVQRSKPDPEGYLLGARAVKLAPAECVVFEDSRAGLEAARNAGMRSMFVRCCAADIPGNTALASASMQDYRSLPPRFWARLREGSLDLAGQAYA